MKMSAEVDAYGRRIAVAVYRSAEPYGSLERFYRRHRKRLIRVTSRLESRDPKYVLDPADPRTSMQVLRVVNLDYSATWAAVYVRPLDEGSIVVVMERKEIPEVSGESDVPDQIPIPRALFEVGLTPLRR